MRKKQELRLERQVLASRCKGEVLLTARESHWGVSTMCYLRRSLFFPLTLRYSKPLVLISHSLYRGKTSHTTIKLVSLAPSTIGKFSLQFPGDSPWECISVLIFEKFLDYKVALPYFFFIGIYLVLENDIWLHQSNYILGSNFVDFENDGYMLDN